MRHGNGLKGHSDCQKITLAITREGKGNSKEKYLQAMVACSAGASGTVFKILLNLRKERSYYYFCLPLSPNHIYIIYLWIPVSEIQYLNGKLGMQAHFNPSMLSNVSVNENTKLNNNIKTVLSESEGRICYANAKD